VPEANNERTYHHGNLRAALLEAAERGLRERGADQLTLRDLARELGVSHAAPSRHFPNRRALLNALAEAGFGRLDAALRAALASAGDHFPSRVRATMTAYTRFATQNAALLELMYASKYQPDSASILKAAEAPFMLMNELTLQGQAQGKLQAGDPEKIGIILFATLQGIVSLINGNVVKPELLDTLVETAVEQFLRGASPIESLEVCDERLNT
jgi:AcrR family transcriptional regulator